MKTRVGEARARGGRCSKSLRRAGNAQVCPHRRYLYLPSNFTPDPSGDRIIPTRALHPAFLRLARILAQYSKNFLPRGSSFSPPFARERERASGQRVGSNEILRITVISATQWITTLDGEVILFENPYFCGFWRGSLSGMMRRCRCQFWWVFSFYCAANLSREGLFSLAEISLVRNQGFCSALWKENSDLRCMWNFRNEFSMLHQQYCLRCAYRNKF